MRLTETIQGVVVQEATVGEIRQWLAGLGTAPAGALTLIDVQPFGAAQLSLVDLRMFVGGGEPLDNLTPSELADVVDVAVRINPVFFGLRALLWQAGAAAGEPTPEPTPEPSPEPPPSAPSPIWNDAPLD